MSLLIELMTVFLQQSWGTLSNYEDNDNDNFKKQ